MTVTFFGHRDVPASLQERLCGILTDLIENENADAFYVGSQGDFDGMVKRTLVELKQKYPQIRTAVVLAYLSNQSGGMCLDGIDTLYPEGLETVPPRFAIIRRNRWMIRNSDTVIVYARYSFGNAFKLKSIARQQGKRVINLAESD